MDYKNELIALMRSTSLQDKKLGTRFLIYAGMQVQTRAGSSVAPWNKCVHLIRRF